MAEHANQPSSSTDDLTRDPPGIEEARAIRRRMHEEAGGDVRRFFERTRAEVDGIREELRRHRDGQAA